MSEDSGTSLNFTSSAGNFIGGTLTRGTDNSDYKVWRVLSSAIASSTAQVWYVNITVAPNACYSDSQSCSTGYECVGDVISIH